MQGKEVKGKSECPGRWQKIHSAHKDKAREGEEGQDKAHAIHFNAKVRRDGKEWHLKRAYMSCFVLSKWDIVNKDGLGMVENKNMGRLQCSILLAQLDLDQPSPFWLRVDCLALHAASMNSHREST